MLYNKVRPHRFDEVVGQRQIVSAIQNQLLKDSGMSLYIFSGQFGSGKTTMARIVALALNCENPDENGNPCLECEHCREILSGNCQDYLEMDAASNSGVEDMKKVMEDVSYLPAFLKKKVYIIDEVHTLSKSAWNAMLKTLEEPPEYVVFLLCTTEVKAIPPTILSRAAVYSFGQISKEDIAAHLEQVAGQNGISLDPRGAAMIARHSQGSMRNALSLLEQAAANGSVTAEVVEDMMGIASLDMQFTLLNAILAGDIENVALSTKKMAAGGKSMLLLLEELTCILSDAVLIAVSADKKEVLADCTEEYVEQISSIPSEINQLIFVSEEIMNLSMEVKKGLPDANYTIMRLMHISRHTERLADIERRLDALEQNREDGQSVFVMSQPLKAEEQSEAAESAEQSNSIPSIPEELTKEPPVEKKKEEPEEKESPVCSEIENDLFSMFGGIQKPSVTSASKSDITYQEASDDDDDSGGAVIVSREKDDVSQAERMQLSEHGNNELLKIERLAMEERFIWTALYKGCQFKEEENHCLIYLTPIQPIAELLNIYFELEKIQAQVKYEPDTELLP